MKKDTMIKDAIILCLITLVLGVALAGVYLLTKEPIEQAQIKANNEACAAVVADGDEVQNADAEMLKKATAYLSSHDLSNVKIDDADSSLIKEVELLEVHPTKEDGLVFLATATKGYGGDISFAVGIDRNNAITGIEITSQAETAGLGANCTDETWRGSFKGKTKPTNPADNMYNKNGATDTQVQALSGATVTTKAITNAIKGIMFATDEIRGAK